MNYGHNCANCGHCLNPCVPILDPRVPSCTCYYDKQKKEVVTTPAFFPETKMTEDLSDTHLYTPEEAKEIRTQWLQGPAPAYVSSFFDVNPEANSCILLMAQYWNDEADDAVHARFMFSSKKVPDLDLLFAAYDQYNFGDAEGEEGLAEKLKLESGLMTRYGGGLYDPTHFWSRHYLSDAGWCSNGDAIPLWASYCKEGANQEQNISEAYTPVALFRREADDSVSSFLIGKELRPYLSGLRPCNWEEEWEEGYHRAKKAIADHALSMLGSVYTQWLDKVTVDKRGSNLFPSRRFELKVTKKDKEVLSKNPNMLREYYEELIRRDKFEKEFRYLLIDKSDND